jgi:hypothetical protein
VAVVDGLAVQERDKRRLRALALAAGGMSSKDAAALTLLSTPAIDLQASKLRRSGIEAIRAKRRGPKAERKKIQDARSNSGGSFSRAVRLHARGRRSISKPDYESASCAMTSSHFHVPIMCQGAIGNGMSRMANEWSNGLE